MLRVGLISDTHGLLRPQALNYLRGCNVIVHAGDIGEQSILAALATIAPVTAVRGNMDLEGWTRSLPHSATLIVGEVLLYVVHDLEQIDIEPVRAGVRVVISGHTHAPALERRHGVQYVNPGSAGPRRLRLPIAVGELLIRGREVVAHTKLLSDADPAASTPAQP